MEHAIRHEISVRVEENPVFYQLLRERLDAAQQLSLLNSLRTELQGEQNQAQELGVRTYAAEPDRGRRNWRQKPYARATVYANRRRIRGARHGDRETRTVGATAPAPS